MTRHIVTGILIIAAAVFGIYAMLQTSNLRDEMTKSRGLSETATKLEADVKAARDQSGIAQTAQKAAEAGLATLKSQFEQLKAVAGKAEGDLKAAAAKLESDLKAAQEKAVQLQQQVTKAVQDSETWKKAKETAEAAAKEASELLGTERAARQAAEKALEDAKKTQ